MLVATPISPSVRVAKVRPSVRPVLRTEHAFATVLTPWGTCGVVWENHESETIDGFAVKPAGALLCRIYTPGVTPSELCWQIRQRYPQCDEVFANEHGAFHTEVVPEWFPELTRYLENYYSAALRGLTHPQFLDNWAFWQPRLDWGQLTPFQRQVLEVVASIPSGSHMTYGQVAKAIGNPAASRAVGAAIGSNPWPVLVPCHRVIGSTGKLTGFSAPGGIETKRRMLALEAM